MAGDITRETFDPERHFTSVRQQQGRVQLDADWNEQADVVNDLRRVALGHVIGPSGAPKVGGGFEVTANAAGDDLLISAGEMYVGGIRCISDAGQTYSSQDDLPTPVPLTTLANGRYLAYLDVWELDVTSIQDPSLPEPALGGPDTTTRRRTVSQVRLAPVAAGATCADFDAAWEPPGLPTGTLRATNLSGFRRLENQLYRIVVHRGSEGGATPTFKFSRDNASVRFAVESISGRTVTLRDLGPDTVRTLERGDWIEILDDDTLLDGGSTQLYPVGSVDLSTREVILDGTDPLPTAGSHTFVQRWDHVERDVALIDGALPIDTTADVTLEDGVVIRFSGTTFRAGDYWLAPARAASGAILWPTSGSNPANLTPQGPKHHYAPLGIVDRDVAGWSDIADCRDLFPALTAIEATDVSYDPSGCALVTATNVQEAIDQLCGQIRDGCTVTITPDSDIEAVIAAFNQSQIRDAKICFQAGEYRATQPLVIASKGHLVLEGFGDGTRWRALQIETFFRFESCASVTVRNVRVETGRAVRTQTGLGGGLHFVDCRDVTVERVGMITAHGTERAAAAITVNDRQRQHGIVRVENCDLEVGHQQLGVLVLNGRTVHVRNNWIRRRALPASIRLRTMIDNPIYRAATRRAFLLSGSQAEDLIIDAGGAGPAGVRAEIASAGEMAEIASRRKVLPSVEITRGNQTVTFHTPTSLRGLWQPLIDAHRVEGATSSEFFRSINRVVDEVLLNEGHVGVGGFGRFRDWFGLLDNQNEARMGQGIVIGGTAADDVWITDNRIAGTDQGIHIGVSHREQSAGTPDMVGNIVVRGNSIAVTLTPIVLKRPEGIFVGNASSTVIDQNRIVVTKTQNASGISVNGILCHGHFGSRMVVRDNHVSGATTGIRVVPLNTRSPRRWLVIDNVAEGTKSAASAPVSVDVFANMPGGTSYRDLENLARS